MTRYKDTHIKLIIDSLTVCSDMIHDLLCMMPDSIEKLSKADRDYIDEKYPQIGLVNEVRILMDLTRRIDLRAELIDEEYSPALRKELYTCVENFDVTIDRYFPRAHSSDDMPINHFLMHDIDMIRNSIQTTLFELMRYGLPSKPAILSSTVDEKMHMNGVSKDDEQNPGELKVASIPAPVKTYLPSNFPEAYYPELKNTFLSPNRAVSEMELEQPARALYWFYMHDTGCAPAFSQHPSGKIQAIKNLVKDRSYKSFQTHYNGFCTNFSERVSETNIRRIKTVLHLLEEYPKAYKKAVDDLRVAQSKQTSKPLT